MRWGFPLAVSALFLLSAVDLSAQARTSAMAVSVRVVRSSPSGDASADANGSAALPAGTAANPTPAAPRQSEAADVDVAPSSTETTSSVRIHTINY